MKSKANIKTHPLHPILVVFPIAFFTGAFIFDALELLNMSSYGQTALYLNIAGIIGGLAAAIPGFIDYLFTVPPKSSAKKRATKHGLINVTVIVIFSIALYVRYQVLTLSYVIPLELIGLALMFIAGWMGGTLVHRNQIGVDIRYANAGKWKERYFNTDDKKVLICKTDELQVDQMMLIHLQGHRIVIGRTENEYVAFDDHCTHRGGSLAAGTMICGTVQCPWHGSRFNVESGAMVTGPAKENIKTYRLSEQDGQIFLEV